MKKIFKKNQIIITALAIMIAAAGYINYSDSGLQLGESKEEGADQETVSETADFDTVLSDIESLDQDLTDETAKAEEEMTPEGEKVQEEEAQTSAETPGEAVLTGAATYSAQARITREQTRAQNKETLLEIINNEALSQEQKEEAIASMVNMTDLAEKEEAAELLLQAKGFEHAVVNLTGDTADVVVSAVELDDAKRAQIEDIVKRKTGVEGENIVITPMNQETEGENGEV